MNSNDISSRFINISVKDVKMLVDPCKFHIVGEPVDSGKNYVKLKFNCKNAISNNTLSLKALKNNSFEEIINIVAYLNKFDPKIVMDSTKWKCVVDSKLLEKNDVINSTSQINCDQI